MKKVILATSALASSVMFANSASALTATFDSTIDVADALAVTQNTQMNFGMISNPSGAVVVHLTQAGGNGTATTASMIDTASMAAGSYKIAGSATHSISINGTDGGTANFTFNTISCKYNGGAETDIIASAITAGAAPAAGKNLICGAKLAVAAAVDDGTWTPDLDITVAYE